MKWFLNSVYPVFIFISCVFKRDVNIWVFGNQKRYFDNTRYFFEYVSLHHKGQRCVWLANDIHELDEVRSLGFKAVLKNSFLGFWLSSRAGFTFICNGYSDVNRLLSLCGVVINFWHGTPIKKIYLDSKYDLQKLGRNKFSLWFSFQILDWLNRQVDLYVASNSYEQKLVVKAAGFKMDKSVVLGAPRFDFMRSVAKVHNLPKGSICLYAPTWREDKFASPEFKIKPEEYANLNNFLSKNEITLLIKQHPLTNKNELISNGLLASKHIVYADDLGIFDINYLYRYSDYLVTDISSAQFDFSLFDRPVVLFMPDVDRYLSGDRGVYSDYIELLQSDSVITTWGSLIRALEAKNFPSLRFVDDVSEEISRLDNVCENIYKEIMRRFL